jgi:hypothetical protein
MACLVPVLLPLFAGVTGDSVEEVRVNAPPTTMAVLWRASGMKHYHMTECKLKGPSGEVRVVTEEMLASEGLKPCPVCCGWAVPKMTRPARSVRPKYQAKRQETSPTADPAGEDKSKLSDESPGRGRLARQPGRAPRFDRQSAGYSYNGPVRSSPSRFAYGWRGTGGSARYSRGYGAPRPST